MPVTLYNYADPDAPVLNGIAGSMITVLDAVLVNGYGDKPGAGWTKEFSGTNVAVYRNNPNIPGSTGMYLKVIDTFGRYAEVYAYKSMADINTGTDVIPSGNPSSNTNKLFWPKSSNNDPRLWAIMADERTFYLQINTYGDPSTNLLNISGLYVFGAGDYESFVPGNEWNYFLIGNYDSGANSTSYSLFNYQSSNPTAMLARSQDLHEGKNTAFYLLNGDTRASGHSSSHPYSPFTGLRFYYPGFIVENQVQTNITGRLRGAYGLVERGSINWIENYGPLPDNPSGGDLIQFLSSSSGNPGLYISSGEW